MAENEDFVPNLVDMHAAFKVAFPGEKMEWVEYDLQGKRVALTIKSDMMTRTYEVTAETIFLDLFKNTPELA